MTKRVLDVGNCDPDHAAIRRLVEKTLGAEVVRAQQGSDALELLRATPFDLVLINRKLDADYSDGIEILKQLKADPELGKIPVMLITNYPEHQQSAVDAGALPGFGKQQLHSPETRERLEAVLGTPSGQAVDR